MTMRLTIKNEDAEREAAVDIDEFIIGEPLPKRTEAHLLPPGRVLEVYIHALKRVVITEKV